MLMTRAQSPDEDRLTPVHELATQQRRVLEFIQEYERTTGEGCPARLMSRRFNLHHTTIMGHLDALHRKGWLRSPAAPAYLRGRS